jgi:hypothetical protein
MGDKVSWRERDTAIYVLSTLNLLSGLSPDALTQRLRRTAHIRSYAVATDLLKPGIYFILLERADTTIDGACVYRMGWLAPQAATSLPPPLRARWASWSMGVAYRSDPTRVVYSATSLMPR